MRLENPAFNYDREEHKYSTRRQTDPRIAQYIYSALGNAKTVLNVGAGAGSYEPDDRYVAAVEPSRVMRTQRLLKGIAPAITGTADALPFDENSFDAVMALVTVHHWPDMKKGLEELKRVARGKVIIMTFDPDSLDKFWNANYFPEVIEIERSRYPKIDFITECLGGKTEVIKIPIPFDCVDGFQEAFYGRPEAFLDEEVRRSQSAWGFIDRETEKKIVESLKNDLESGRWDELYGGHRKMEFFTCALRLIVAHKE